MGYIFNADNQCIGSCNVEPCLEDLSSRGEHAMEYAGECRIGRLLGEGNIPVAPIIPPLTPEQEAANARLTRDGKLIYFDRELYRNQFFWGTLTPEQQAERLAYRQALLDVPQQAGFPAEIVWPAHPAP